MKAELVSKRLGMAKDFNFSLIFQFGCEDGSLTRIPAEIKEYPGSNYQAYLAKEQRNWSRLLAIADARDINSDYPMLYRNLDKAYAYYTMDDLASAKLFANKALDLQDQVGPGLKLYLPEDIYILMGETDQAINALHSGMSEFLKYSHQGQDKSSICRMRIDEIIVLSFAGKFEEATRQLVRLNRDFPAWGFYRILFTDFRTDRIRKEYPPFNEALRNLKLPPLIEFPAEYQDM